MLIRESESMPEMTWPKVLCLPFKGSVCFEADGEDVKIRRASSKITQCYGSVTPRNKPEDFQALREEFEIEVALDCVKESS